MTEEEPEHLVIHVPAASADAGTDTGVKPAKPDQEEEEPGNGVD